MTIAQFIVSYSVCWWLVLFMVLPSGVETEDEPGLGHAPSAPKKPGLKRKFLLTTIFAIFPTILVYFVASNARAEETIYHVGGGCDALEDYSTKGDVNARDGYGTGDKKVAPANLEGSSTVLGDIDHVDIPLQIPTKNYIDPTKHNVDLSESEIGMGKLRVGMDGSTELNGRPIKNQSTFPKDCGGKKKDQ